MCDCLRQLTEDMGWEFPFSKPISYKEGELKAHDWAVTLHKATKTGKRARESMFLFLSYCPICGDALREGRICINNCGREALYTVMFDGLSFPRPVCEECKIQIEISDIAAYGDAVFKEL